MYYYFRLDSIHLYCHCAQYMYKASDMQWNPSLCSDMQWYAVICSETQVQTLVLGIVYRVVYSDVLMKWHLKMAVMWT